MYCRSTLSVGYTRSLYTQYEIKSNEPLYHEFTTWQQLRIPPLKTTVPKLGSSESTTGETALSMLIPPILSDGQDYLFGRAIRTQSYYPTIRTLVGFC